MNIVFVLVEVETGKIANVLQKIKKVPGVIESYGITGPFDIHAKLSAETIEETKEIIEEIQNIQGVVRTLSSIVLPY